MPEPAPVTTAFFPSSRNGVVMIAWTELGSAERSPSWGAGDPSGVPISKRYTLRALPERIAPRAVAGKGASSSSAASSQRW